MWNDTTLAIDRRKRVNVREAAIAALTISTALSALKERKHRPVVFSDYHIRGEHR